jgi:glutamyl-tRNA synthetase
MSSSLIHTAQPVRVRIAPSPTGNCHVGTARSALYNLLFARRHNGTFILRIDDTDLARSTAASERGVIEGLRWLGLDWDEGPDVGGPYGPYRQSERLDRYRAYVNALLESGRAYRCFCTPEDLALARKRSLARGVPPKYSGRCRYLDPATVGARLRAGESSVVRLRIEPKTMAFVDLVQGRVAQDAALLGDPVIQKSDGMPTYHFATVVDEHLMRISHVIRGAEHLNNTFPQLQIYEALGFAPPAFAHVGLLLNRDRSKISKRTGAVYLGEFAALGYLPEAMVNHLALSGWSPGTGEEVFSWEALLDAFSLDRCSPSNGIYDRDKLLWLNGQHIRALPVPELARRVTPFLAAAGLVPEGDLPADTVRRIEAIVALEQGQMRTLDEAPDLVAYVLRDPDPAACVELLASNRFTRRRTLDALRAGLAASVDALTRLVATSWTPGVLDTTLNRVVEDLGWKRGELLMALRIAVSGREATPSLYETLAAVGRGAVLRRLGAVVRRLPEGAAVAQVV